MIERDGKTAYTKIRSFIVKKRGEGETIIGGRHLKGENGASQYIF